MKKNEFKKNAMLALLFLFPALLVACGESSSSSSSNETFFYKTVTSLSDECNMEFAKMGDTFWGCFDNDWFEVTDSDVAESIENISDENEKKKLLKDIRKKFEDNSKDNADESSSSIEQYISYGCMSDSRDLQKYKTIKIGNQVWMAENLNFYDENNLSLKGESWCYNDDDANCEQMGRLYTWSAAIDRFALWNKGKGVACGYDMTCNLYDKVQGVCPSGWHLPQWAEWEELFKSVGGESVAIMALKSKFGWDDGIDGVDTYGFSALPSGYKDFNDEFRGLEYISYFWSDAENNREYAYSFSLKENNDYANLYPSHKNNGFSVRCIQNNPSNEKKYEDCIIGEDNKKIYSSSSSYVKSFSNNTNCSRGGIWDWKTPKECYLNPNVVYDEFTDSRDGKKYRSVTIGSRIWMAENLNYYDSTLEERSWCYRKLNTSCEKAGRLYTWAVAIGKTEKECGFGKECNLKPGKIQGVCPHGWHLPNFEEWNALINEDVIGGQIYAGKILKSQSGWKSDYHENGIDFYGFAAIPAGILFFDNSDMHFYNAGAEVVFWSATEYDAESAYEFKIGCGNGDEASYDSYDKRNGYSIRCVKDSK